MANQGATPDKPSQAQGASGGDKGPMPERFERFADDATGINVPDRKPIDSRMPSLPPA
jgi:hypothetical protein